MREKSESSNAFSAMMNRIRSNETVQEVIVNRERDVFESEKFLSSFSITVVEPEGRIVTEVNSEVNAVD